MRNITESPEIINKNIKEWNIPMPDRKYKVVIHCSTYNHGKYIEDALKGFVMQKTNFPFCAIIIDDASTDNNVEIIRKYAEQYPDIIKPICLGYNHMRHGLSRNPYFEPWHESCEYLAQCEGDDYWIDPLKLQKQVDALDSDDSATFSYSSFKNVDMNGKEELRPFFERCIQRSHSGNVLYDLFTQNFIMTLTIMHRRSMELGHSYFDNYQGPKCDYYLFMLLSTKGNAVYIDEEMGCYRNNPHGLINTDKQQIDDIIWQIYKYFALGVVGRQLARRLSFSVIVKLYCQFFYRAVNKYIRRQDKTFIFLLIKYIFSIGR